MSDDDDYYFYENEDGDLLWYEDANLGYAVCDALDLSEWKPQLHLLHTRLTHVITQDELAEATIHSPIPVEDPSLDAMESYSDWEYYSDDYYDDDPTIMKKQKTDKSQDAEYPADEPPPTRKRKFVAVDDIPELSIGDSIVELPTDPASFKGIVWKESNKTEKKPALYEPGQGEEFALLKDWREVFKASQYRSDWFQGGQKDVSFKANGRTRLGSVNSLRELAPESQDNSVVEDDYMSYSPPPLAIAEVGKSLIQQKEKKSHVTRPSSHLQEVVAIENISDVATPLSSPEKEHPDPNAIVPDPKQTNYQQLLRVEIPTTSAPAPAPSPSPATPSRISPQRRRGRPRASTSVPVKKQTANHQSSSARQKVPAQVEEEDNDRRRSTRLVPPRNDKSFEDKKGKRKRTRDPSPIPLRRGRSKRTKT
jgi:hypothetical protein